MTASCINLIKMFHLKYINSCVKSSLSQDYTYFVLCYQGKNKTILLPSEVLILKIISVMKITNVTIITLASKFQNAIKYSFIIFN